MTYMKKVSALTLLLAGLAIESQAQVLLSNGTYTQNFDSLAGTGTANAWTDNSTLLGWYAQSTNTTVVTTDYRADNGGSNTGDLISYGTTGSAERALGSVCSGGSATIGYGLRVRNDTAQAFNNITISYTGEQWRNGGNTTAQTLAFSYRIGSSAITSPDVPSAFAWTSFAALNFTTPIATATAAALDGNAAANRIALSSVLTGVTLNAGEEIFFRWIDLNDAGNDHGVSIDNLTITTDAVTVPEPATMALAVVGGLAGLLVLRRKR